MGNHDRRSILCPNCRKLISAEETLCPYCGISRPTSWWKNNALTRTFLDGEQLIKTIMYLNGGMFVLSLLVSQKLPNFTLNPLTFLSPDDGGLFLLGATGTIPIARFHRWWSLISANYLHGGILHILFNMMALRQIGPLIIREYGGNRMFVIYTLSGVLGYYLSYLFGVPLTIGASAAICGLIGAALFYGKSRGGAYGQAIYSQVGGWAVGIFVFGFLIPGINNWGHGGGLVAGIILGFLLGYEEKKPETAFHKMLSAGLVVCTLLALSFGVISALFYVLLSPGGGV